MTKKTEKRRSGKGKIAKIFIFVLAVIMCGSMAIGCEGKEKAEPDPPGPGVETPGGNEPGGEEPGGNEPGEEKASAIKVNNIALSKAEHVLYDNYSKEDTYYESYKTTLTKDRAEVKIVTEGFTAGDDVIVSVNVYISGETKSLGIYFADVNDEYIDDDIMPAAWSRINFLSEIEGSGKEQYVRFYVDDGVGAQIHFTEIEVSKFQKPETLLGGAKLYQLPPQTSVQQMSFVLVTADEKVVVIDGGKEGDGEYMYRFLTELGGRVDAWIITHAHSDHFGALQYILQKNKNIEIEKLYYNFFDLDWYLAVEPDNIARPFVQAADKAVSDGKLVRLTTRAGDEYAFGDVKIKVLNDPQKPGDGDAVNNSGIVLRIITPQEDVLMLGDAGPGLGKYLLKNVAKADLECKIVQMAHHGQSGVDEAFYKVVKPEICLWTVTDWLWNNWDNSGTLKIYETRHWMQEAGVYKNCVAKEGLYCIE